MVLNERQEKIVSYLKEQRRVTVKKMSEIFFVSEMTIRRDLKELEKQGYLRRYNGGALYSDHEHTLPITARRLINSEEKKHLAERAGKYLRDGLTIYIDSSSTCTYLIPLLAEYQQITIITNSLMAVHYASQFHIRCILAGGEYYEQDMCTIGSMTDEFLHNINADVAFFSALGLSEDGIISDSDERQTAVRRAIMKNCQKNIFLFDNEKINRKYPFTLCRTDQVTDVFII